MNNELTEIELCLDKCPMSHGGHTVLCELYPGHEGKHEATLYVHPMLNPKENRVVLNWEEVEDVVPT